ncbi:MAG: hypothetical protein WC943_17210, partial [Elusimicrobiota bacterium]
KAGGLEAIDGGSATQGNGPAGLGPLAGAQLSTQLGGSVTGARFNGPDGSITGGQLSAPKRDKVEKGTAGTLKKRETMSSSRMGNIRNNIRNSRSLGRLRAMSPFNRRMMQSGVSATEAEASEASVQFEASEAEGAIAPTGPEGADNSQGGNPGGGSNSGGTGETCACNWETQTCVGGVCQAINVGPGINATPWESLVQEGKGLKASIQMMMLLGAVMFTIGRYWRETCSTWVAWIFYAIGAALMMAAISMCKKMMDIGKKINSMGGKPQGDQFIGMGQAYIGGCVLMMATWFFAISIATSAMVFLLVQVAIMRLAEIVGGMLK